MRKWLYVCHDFHIDKLPKKSCDNVRHVTDHKQHADNKNHLSEAQFPPPFISVFGAFTSRVYFTVSESLEDEAITKDNDEYG